MDRNARLTRRLVRTTMLGLLAAPLATTAALAQATPPANVHSVRGTVQSLNGDTLMVETAQGTSTVHLQSGWGVRAVVPSSLSAVKPGTFIGTATVGPQDHMVAREVLLFPAAMKGTGEGSYPWDLTPESTMTNATVDAEVTQSSGQELKLSYKGGTRTVTVPAGTPIVTIEPGDKAMVVKGAHVFVRGPAQPDGSINASGIAVGKNGLTPPM